MKILKACLEALMDTSSGLEVLVFKEFRDNNTVLILPAFQGTIPGRSVRFIDNDIQLKVDGASEYVSLDDLSYSEIFSTLLYLETIGLGGVAGSAFSPEYVKAILVFIFTTAASQCAIRNIPWPT